MIAPGISVFKLHCDKVREIIRVTDDVGHGQHQQHPGSCQALGGSAEHVHIDLMKVAQCRWLRLGALT
jgi:hypothetical protein